MIPLYMEVVVGGALGVAGSGKFDSSGRKSSSKSEEESPLFDFVLLNDSTRLKADLKGLNELCDEDLFKRLPATVSTLIATAEKEETKQVLACFWVQALMWQHGPSGDRMWPLLCMSQSVACHQNHGARNHFCHHRHFASTA